MMTVPAEEAPANSVPAAAVIRRGLALLGITGRKEHVGGDSSQSVLSAVPRLSPGLSRLTRLTAYVPFTPSNSEQR